MRIRFSENIHDSRIKQVAFSVLQYIVHVIQELRAFTRVVDTVLVPNLGAYESVFEYVYSIVHTC